MSERLRCPACHKPLPAAGEAGPPARCPACGARLAARPKPPAEPAEAGAAAPAERPRRSRRKRRRKKPVGFDWLRLLRAGGAALLLLAASLGFSQVVRVVVERRGPRPETASAPAAVPEPDAALRPPPDVAPAAAVAPVVQPAPEPARWEAGPDPAPRSAALPTAARDLGIPLEGDPLFAAGDALFVVDGVERLAPSGRHAARRDASGAPVLDLRTSKPVGSLAGNSPRGRTSVLSPDGQYLVGPGPGGKSAEVWKVGAAQPVGRLQPPGGVAWLDFLGPDEVAVRCGDDSAAQVQVWSASKCQLLRTFALPARIFPPATRPPMRGRRPPPTFVYRGDRFSGAISPGGKYLALGGPSGVAVLALADGRTVGTVPVGGPMEYRGLGFSEDGAEVIALVLFGNGQNRPVRLLAWKMADGGVAADVQLADPHAAGPVLPGPAPGTVFVGEVNLGDDGRVPVGHVIDTHTGTAIAEVPYTPVRWLADGKLLAVGPIKLAPASTPLPASIQRPDTEDMPAEGARRELAQWDREHRNDPHVRAVYAVPFDRKEYAASAEAGRAATAPRPPAGPGERDATKSILPPGTVAWALRPEPPPDAPPLRPALDIGAGGAVCFSEAPAGRAVVLGLRFHDRPRARFAVTASWFDLRTGKRLGEAELWPWFRSADGADRKAAPAPDWAVAGVSADGTRLALRDPAAPGRVDVWDDGGKRLLGLLPYGGTTPVDWLGWAADGRLLTLGGGKVTAWEVPAGREVFEVDGSRAGFGGVAVLGPSRAWLAVPCSAGVHVLETASGRVLGQLPLPGSGATPWDALAVSPDGRRLAGIRAVVGKPDAGVVMTLWDGSQRSDDRPGWLPRLVYTWDLTTGKPAEPFLVRTDTASPLHWCGPRHLLCGGRNLVDLDARVVVKAYAVLGAVVPESPDGRLWYRTTHPQGGVPVWALVNCQVPAHPVEGEVAFHPGVPVKVETECGSADHNRQVAAALTQALMSDGFRPGPGGWTVRVTADQYDSGQKLVRSREDRNGIPIPAVRYRLRLVAPDGAEVPADEGAARFTKQHSKYFVQRKRGEVVFETIELYDFQGQDAQTAIAGEIWERLADAHFWGKWPRGVLKVRGKYENLPQTGRLEPAGG